MKWRSWVTLAGLAWACEGEPPPTVIIPPTRDECHARRDTILCSEGVALACTAGEVGQRTVCADQGLACVEGVGCRACTPFAISCDGERPLRCDEQGNVAVPLDLCAPGMSCGPLGCRDLCAEAARERSYLGCDYWPVFTSNSGLDDAFFPAVSIGNGNLVPAHVTITKGSERIELELPARSAKTVELSFDPALRQSGGSTWVRDGAYHLQSTAPVTVHQFNPLSFSVPAACAGDAIGPCYSYTNDASLLLPAAALVPAGDEGEDAQVRFVAISRPTFMPSLAEGGFAGAPGFVAVVAMGDRPVGVRVTASAHTRPSLARDEEGALPAMAPGDVLERVLQPGDVLQLLSDQPPACPSVPRPSARGTVCDPGPAYDLTGTEISADGPIQVIGGHDCTNVPIDRFACDHLEESMTPVRTWGTSAVVFAPRSQAGSGYLLRLLSGEDANTITFDPPVSSPLTLARGQYVELELTESVYVEGTGRLLAAQYLLGQGGTQEAHGDPSLSLVVPVDQYRSEYIFMSPATYSINYVSIVALRGDAVWLDDKLITTFEPLGSSKFEVARVQLSQPGAHVLRGASAAGVGVMLYGMAPYTSYMLPGGLDLAPLGVPGF